jgi:sugar/nucleoside kinase (ribokinase family)
MIVVAGVVAVRVARQFDSFPIPLVSSTTRQGEISLRLAGSGWTAARTLQRLGAETTFATYVGADELGQFAAQGLARDGLYGPTTLVCDTQPRSMILYDRQGRRCGASDLRSTPWLRYPPDIFRSAVDKGCTAAILTNIGFTRSLIPAALALAIPIATDLHLFDSIERNRDWLEAAHILARSHETLPESPENWIGRIWRTFGTEAVLVGCGDDGAVLGIRSAQRIWHIRGLAPRGVRFVGGAGDTLLAAFVRQYFTLGDPLTAARQAVLAAGWKVGGSPEEAPGISADDLAVLQHTTGLPAVTCLR